MSLLETISIVGMTLLMLQLSLRMTMYYVRTAADR
jgi:hypothetical protein